MDYVLGFAFDCRCQQVLLIQKIKPEWQAGSLNGVGGKIEKGETPLEAMSRECWEESGIEIEIWNEIPPMVGFNWKVHVFRAHTDRIFDFVNRTKEACGVYSVNRLPLNVLNNLNWLIPMCLDDDIDSKESVIKFK